MEGQFTVQLFDILVYLLPGGILLSGGLLLTGYNLEKGAASGTFHSTAVTLLAMFLLGVLAHVATLGAYSVVRRLTNTSVQSWTLTEFEELDAIEANIESRLGHKPNDIGDVYRFAEIAVNQQAPGQAASVSRLVALSLFCRNSILPMFVLAGGLWRRWSKGHPVRRWILGLGLITAEFLFVVGFIRYSSVAITKVMRTYTFIELFQ